MDYNELFYKYQEMITENNYLKEEIKMLRAQLTFEESNAFSSEVPDKNLEVEILVMEEALEDLSLDINNKSNNIEKIEFFMSLFKCKRDLYCLRYGEPYHK